MQEQEPAHARLTRVMKPAGHTYHGGGTTGDGDPCPLTPEHGKMLVIPQTQAQVCPHQTHDGVWAQGEHHQPTRSRWPLGSSALRAAVTSWEVEHA